jgi:hypothetical protein
MPKLFSGTGLPAKIVVNGVRRLIESNQGKFGLQ